MDSSNYGLIFSAEGDRQMKRSGTHQLTRASSLQFCTQGIKFKMWFHLTKLNLVVWTTINIFISHNVWN